MTATRKPNTSKRSLDEIQDERELRDPKIRTFIKKGYQEFLAAKSRPIKELFAERVTRRETARPSKKRPPHTGY